MDASRHRMLRQLADDGDQIAAWDLWTEFGEESC